MGDSIMAGVGDEVLITVCCGAVLAILAGVLTLKRPSSTSVGAADEEQRASHIYNNETCPICLGPHRLPVETNCGHKFCGTCVKNYLSARLPRDFSIFSGRLSCPMCRQDINILLVSFMPEEIASSELAQERADIETTVHEYNIRYGSGDRSWYSYVRDCPVLVRHLMVDFFSFGGLLWMFRLRVIFCFLGAVMYLLFPADIIPETMFGFFGLVDDLIVFFLCAIYVSILYRRYILSRGTAMNVSDS